MAISFKRLGSSRGIHFDWALLVVVVAIATIGIVNLYSATSPYLGDPRKGGLADIYVSQIYWFVVGLLIAIPVAALDYRHFERLAYVIYGAGNFLLVLTLLFANDLRGSKRWLDIFGFKLQASEIMKVAVVLVIAKYVHDDSKTEPRNTFDLLPPILLAFVPVGLVMAQPDLGTSLMYLFATVSMLAMISIRRSTVLLLSSMSVGTALFAWNFVMKKYQKGRIESWLDPDRYKSDEGWHAYQSITAIGNGGFFGEGFMQGTQNQFHMLPDQYSDFPFTVYSEEFGLVGCLVLFSLYAFLCIWSVHIASQAKDRFGAALALGVGSLMFWQFFANVGMVMGVLPVVGITLPLFSYGGSSVVAVMFSLALLMSVSMRRG